MRDKRQDNGRSNNSPVGNPQLLVVSQGGPVWISKPLRRARLRGRRPADPRAGEGHPTRRGDRPTGSRCRGGAVDGVPPPGAGARSRRCDGPRPASGEAQAADQLPGLLRLRRTARPRVQCVQCVPELPPQRRTLRMRRLPPDGAVEEGLLPPPAGTRRARTPRAKPPFCTLQLARIWLDHRRRRWPDTADLRLLINKQTALETGPVSGVSVSVRARPPSGHRGETRSTWPPG